MIASPVSTEALWETFHDRLHQFIRAHVADPMTAEDILQTVFLTVHQRSSEVRDATRLVSWLFQITRHAIIDAYRERHTLPLPDDAAERFAAPTMDPPDWYQALTPCLYSLLPCLPSMDQEAIRLADLEGVAQRALAARWGLSFSGAKSRIQRARARLKAVLMAGCHVELNRQGVPMGFASDCQCCVSSCTTTASFSGVPRLWEAPTSCAPFFPLRSTTMNPAKTPTTPPPAPISTGGFTKPVTIPVNAATTQCCGAPATDGNTCCGEPVSQVTDTTHSGTDSCCGDSPTTGGSCCN